MVKSWYIGDPGQSGPSCQQQSLRSLVGCLDQGGQRLFTMPDLELVVAITAWNYGTPDQWIPPIRVMREALLASIK